MSAAVAQPIFKVGGPIGFLIAAIGGWVAARIWMLLPSGAPLAATGAGTAALMVAGIAVLPGAPPLIPIDRGITILLDAPTVARPAPIEAPVSDIAEQAPPPETHPASLHPQRAREMLLLASYLAPAGGRGMFQTAAQVGQPPAWVAPPAEGAATKRWSGSAYLFARDGSGAPGLAAGSQLGGSQASARVAYRIDRHLALAARISSPLRHTDGAEAAIGADVHPIPDAPLRLSVERRVALGREGRNAWSAYAAGGFYEGDLPGGAALDGYAQAGVVGAKRLDTFADGALRVGRPFAIDDRNRLTLGGGAWGAAQPGASRLDVGPRAAITMPAGGANVTLAVDWRMRVAGDATPGSGAALTIATDF